MNNFLIKTSVLAIALLVSLPAQAEINVSDIDTMESYTKNAFIPPGHLTDYEYLRLQNAQGLSKSYRSQKAYDLITPLLAKYPDHFELNRLQGIVLLDLGKNEEALRGLDNFLNMKRSAQLTHDQEFEIHRLRAQAYGMAGEHEMALKIIEKQYPEAYLLSPSYRESLFLSKAETYSANQKPFQAYNALTDSINSGLQSAKSRNELSALSVELAEKLYLSGMNDYDMQNYHRAVEQFLAAYQLNPEEVKYSVSLGEAQYRFLNLYEQRFHQSSSVLINAVKNMRRSLADEDYNTLYREYLRLKDEPNIAYVLKHKEYMPISLRDAFASVEKTLKMQGLKIQ